MTPPDFKEQARAWLVQAQGYAQPWHVESLAETLEKSWKNGWTARKMATFHAGFEPSVQLELDSLVTALREIPRETWPAECEPICNLIRALVAGRK